MPFTITLAGQDISQYVDQNTINIQDTLGQGGGAGSGSMTQGRASVAKFNTSLGPVAKAYGAGQAIPPTTTQSAQTRSQDTFVRANQSGSFGTASDGEVWSAVFGAGADRSIVSNTAQYLGTAATHVDVLPTSLGDYTALVTGQITNTSDRFGLVGRYVDSNNFYNVYYTGTTLVLTVKSAGTTSTLQSATVGSLGTGVNLNLQINFSGNTISASVWLASGSQPASYQIQKTDSTFSTGKTGLYGLPATATNAVSFNEYLVSVLVTVTNVPVLVRQGEIIVKDSTGAIVWGGFATKMTDTTTSVLGQNKQPFTTIEGIDYSTSLQRTLVNVSFSAATDIFIIRSILKQYAPWINLAYLPANPGYLFPIKNFRNVSVEQVLQTVAGITGYLVYVDYLKYVHYIPPTQSTSAPYNLSSNPNFLSTFPHAVTEYLVDDNSAINRVWFYGGTKLSNDITQDVSPMANGNNKIFTVAYFASAASDGKYHVILNGVEQVVGTANATGAANTLISAGGTAQVIIDPGSRSVTFDVAPASGATVLFRYRYSYPLSLLLTDENSHKFFGDPYLDGYIDDNTIFDLATAVQRCKVLLAQQNYGLVSFKVDVYNKPGVQAGMVIHIDNALRGINGTYLIQEVVIEALGGDNYVYHLSLGAWNWNLIDFLLKLPTLATFQDNQQETTEQVIIQSIQTNIQVRDTWSKKTSSPPYYARAAVVGDGHDAYPGFSTITS